VKLNRDKLKKTVLMAMNIC